MAGAARVTRGAPGLAVSVAIWVALGVFSIAMTAACLLYPGGSWTLPSADGFSPLRNFWCDLLRARAINGGDNALGKQLALLAFAALGLGLWPFWWVAAAPLEPPRRRLVWRAGATSAAALMAMALLPSDRFPLAHGVVALLGGALGMLATAVCLLTRLPGEARLSLRRGSGLLALTSALGHAGLYVHVAYLHGPESVAHPTTQKAATLALLVWMLATVASARADAARTDAARATRRARTSAV
jgi:hypothetical protein